MSEGSFLLTPYGNYPQAGFRGRRRDAFSLMTPEQSAGFQEEFFAGPDLAEAMAPAATNPPAVSGPVVDGRASAATRRGAYAGRRPAPAPPDLVEYPKPDNWDRMGFNRGYNADVRAAQLENERRKERYALEMARYKAENPYEQMSPEVNFFRTDPEGFKEYRAVTEGSKLLGKQPRRTLQEEIQLVQAEEAAKASAGAYAGRGARGGGRAGGSGRAGSMSSVQIEINALQKAGWSDDQIADYLAAKRTLGPLANLAGQATVQDPNDPRGGAKFDINALKEILGAVVNSPFGPQGGGTNQPPPKKQPRLTEAEFRRRFRLKRGKAPSAQDLKDARAEGLIP